MKNSILALLLTLPMLSFGKDVNQVQLSVFYKTKTAIHETQRVALRQKGDSGARNGFSVSDSGHRSCKEAYRKIPSPEGEAN